MEATGMRGGCDFHQTMMERPERAERHWLVLLVAPWWMVSVGSQVDAMVKNIMGVILRLSDFGITELLLLNKKWLVKQRYEKV